jgi:hypothetical protein
MADRLMSTSVSMVDYILTPLGYTLVAVDFNNVVAVASEYASAFIVPPPDTGLQLWLRGYWQRPEREALFPWNDPVKHWGPSAKEDPFETLRLISDHMIATAGYQASKVTFALFTHPEYVDKGRNSGVSVLYSASPATEDN